ncbi:MAG: 16S rRNA (cytidine(1402)-2'-O)-methyltransferase [Bacteroidales bacterium]|nr:16S rRNA (cytidine(1402)-2'-O)-methyltransferase [Bacteroidales bacterium]
MSKLYIVPTPLGNLEDITLRALRTLKEVDLILAEDTRTTGILLKRYAISNKLTAHHIFNEHKTVQSLIARIKNGETVALVSDAGTPSISDPGYLLVRSCIENNIPVECLPGPTALIPALVNSGFPSDRFCFEGFLPHKKGRQKRLMQLEAETRTIILYESPHRLAKTLAELSGHLGAERKCSVSRELTKVHEETVRGTLKEVHDYFGKKRPKGELVIIVEGGHIK